MSTKYRLVNRKGRWAVQEYASLFQRSEATSSSYETKQRWLNVAIWRWRFLAALHLLILRERGRKSK